MTALDADIDNFDPLDMNSNPRTDMSDPFRCIATP